MMRIFFLFGALYALPALKNPTRDMALGAAGVLTFVAAPAAASKVGILGIEEGGIMPSSGELAEHSVHGGETYEGTDV